MPQYLLQLKCPQHRPREWKPLAVVSMKSSSDFIVVELPQLSLNACQFSNCLNSKCSWTMHSSIRVWARSCCDADQKMCRNDLRLIRAVFYVMSGLFAVGCLIMIPIVIRERRRQQQEARGWALMEIFFVGAFILYLIPLLDWLNPESASCCMAIWMRQIGFTLFYGAVILKIYRNLQEYRVRKAHHVFVRERDLLKYLAGLLALTFMGLTAWSLGAWSYDPLWTSSWPQCPMERWTMMWYVLELIFMLYGLQLCLKARNSTWVERYQFTAAVALETIVSSIINILRYLWANTASNDTLFTMYIIQLHFTISLNIAAIITPKFIIGSSEGNRRMLSMAGASSSGSKAHPSLAKLRDNLINGTIDFAEVPIIDMNPEDIRAELKRVYTQLRMYKLKNLYQDNPHISKRKGGKKTSDKTSKNRRISIPATSSSPKIRRVDEEDEKSDLTVESAPHNIYLSTNKIQLESTDLSLVVVAHRIDLIHNLRVLEQLNTADWVAASSLLSVSSYRRLQRLNHFRHRAVNHGLHFVDPTDPAVHTQTIENKNGQLKDMIRRRHGVVDQILPSLLKEFNWRECFGQRNMKLKSSISFTPIIFIKMTTDLAIHETLTCSDP
uniref:ISXO2-like transposase domain-containing protein n=1 Tax=Acrobeloides nanus TaxID=290746 RepID=A0A914EIS2_9BILA